MSTGVQQKMNTNEVQPFEILLVEDNPGDVRLIKEIFKEAEIQNNMQVAMDGEIALQILLKEGKFHNTPCPDLILLDLNLPKKDGRELLSEIKANKELKNIPVVILTTSTAKEDIIDTYNNHANSYISKPADLYQFIKAVESIKNFWLSTVKLPGAK